MIFIKYLKIDCPHCPQKATSPILSGYAFANCGQFRPFPNCPHTIHNAHKMTHKNIFAKSVAFCKRIVYILTYGLCPQPKNTKVRQIIMNKSQLKQIEMARAYIQNGMADCAARSVSGLIRSAMSAKSRNALLAFALENGLTNQPDFIV